MVGQEASILNADTFFTSRSLSRVISSPSALGFKKITLRGVIGLANLSNVSQLQHEQAPM